MPDPIAVIEAMPEDRWYRGDFVDIKDQHVVYDMLGWLLHEAGVPWPCMEWPALARGAGLLPLDKVLRDEYGLTVAMTGRLICLNDDAGSAREAKERAVSYLREEVSHA